ncbi:hypothetical protein L596_015008 [Steinernema carpocapsae]|uniref:Uncharacterized protein n=1 Tax=Steinernema carpocapsae TaxID=34508 RepID=A0A4U5NEK0_STECR|nr:hypothetical protein L596_015008 [Steinernema carpocapsae]
MLTLQKRCGTTGVVAAEAVVLTFDYLVRVSRSLQVAHFWKRADFKLQERLIHPIWLPDKSIFPLRFVLVSRCPITLISVSLFFPLLECLKAKITSFCGTWLVWKPLKCLRYLYSIRFFITTQPSIMSLRPRHSTWPPITLRVSGPFS